MVVGGFPTRVQLMNPTLDALNALGGIASREEILREVIRAEGFSDEIVEQLHGGGPQTELDYELAWARTCLKTYGVIDNLTRGTWSLTEKGRRTAKVDPKKVDAFFRERNSARREQRKAETPTDDSLEPDTGDVEGIEAWRERLVHIVKQMEHGAFERLCQVMLRESEFYQVNVTGRSGDGGIDGTAILRLNGLVSFPVLFQCKRYAGSVPAGVVRDFRGAMQGRADKGLIVTTGNFTRAAQEEATRDGAPPIDLIDGEALVGKLKELELGVKVEMVESIEIDEGWFEKI